MGGSPVAIVGYSIDTTKVTTYMQTHQLGSWDMSLTSIKNLLMHLDKDTSTDVTLARLEDGQGASHYFLCCFANKKDGWIEYSDNLSAVQVPTKFTSTVQGLSHDTSIKRACAAVGQLYSFDTSGRSRF